MRILGLLFLDDFKKSHADARGPLDAWRREVEEAEWQSPQDIKQRYRSADFLGDNRVIFNIKGNNYRLVVKVRYQNGMVVVEWVGTHAEYSKKRF
jgi:mRNA interferase HigB